jgi:SAM-dependent methyltransferase
VTKLTWPAPERNKQPILSVLQRVLPERGTLLELASGTGQHASYFAQHMPGWTLQPSDLEATNLASISAWVRESALPNLLEPLSIDVCSDDWGVSPTDAIYNANLIHIAPWEAAMGLMRGAARHLLPHGVVVLYGPYRIAGQHTAPSNASFDDDLKRRDPRFGVRDLEAVVDLAAQNGLELRERVEMPANNQTLVLSRRA